MPSTLVHVGFAALIAAALLGPYFDARALLVVFLVTSFPDIDTLIGIWIMTGAHRTLLHNLLFPSVIVLGVVWDVYFRDESFILNQWGTAGFRVLLVSVIGGWIVAHILLDAFFNGVNLAWPFYDQYIDLSGELYYSNHHGLVQTFMEFERTTDGSGMQIAEANLRGNRLEHHYYTGVDPGPDYPTDVERRFPIADRGTLFVVMLVGYVAAGLRLIESYLARSQHRMEDS